ncbi:MAG: thioredoxin [bacterium]
MGKGLVTATDSNFDELLKSRELLVIDFWAEWCGPCQRLTPIIEKVANEYAGRIIVAKLNVDENTNIATKYMIMSIPTLIFFKDGKEINKTIGLISENELKKKIDSFL